MKKAKKGTSERRREIIRELEILNQNYSNNGEWTKLEKLKADYLVAELDSYYNDEPENSTN